MSVRVMSRVWDCSKSSGGARLVLLAIADFCDDEGRAYPAIPTLARKANLSERTTQYALRELQDLGELRIEANAGRSRANIYIVTVSPDGAKSAPSEDVDGAKSAPVQNLRGAKSAPLMVQNLHPDGADVCTLTVIEPSLEPSVKGTPSPLPPEPTQKPQPTNRPTPAPKRTNTPDTGDTEARLLLAAFRAVRHPKAGVSIPAAEWQDIRSVAKAMARDRVTPEQVESATAAALRRFKTVEMVTFRSVARHFTTLLEPDAQERREQSATDRRVEASRAAIQEQLDHRDAVLSHIATAPARTDPRAILAQKGAPL